MKILIVSNYYPPYIIGGYELGCHEVAKALRERGHAVKVLTSTYGVGSATEEADVSRSLLLTVQVQKESPLTRARRLVRIETNNQKEFPRLCSAFRPDVVYFWNMRGISISLVFAAERLRLPVSIYVSDNWLSRWKTDLWHDFSCRRGSSTLNRLLLRVVRQIARLRGCLVLDGAPDLRHVQFCSLYLKNDALLKGVPVEKAEVIHWGTNASLAPLDSSAAPRRLLYVGQIVPNKGPHIAIEALSLLAREGCAEVTLTLVGGSVQPEYEASVRQLAVERGLGERCRFAGVVPRQDLLPLYSQYDILVFPSSWEEPFAITPLEAMASGLVVVGTTTGGSGEIFQDGVNALTFVKDDAVDCARQIKRLLGDEALFRDIRKSGQETIRARFGFDVMVDKIEHSLNVAVDAAS